MVPLCRGREPEEKVAQWDPGAAAGAGGRFPRKLFSGAVFQPKSETEIHSILAL